MPILTTYQTLLVDGVEDIVLTDAVIDPNSGDFVREIRVLGTGEIPVLVLRVMADEKAKINLTAPVQDF